MDFSAFESAVAKIKNLPLPGEGSHMEMAPLERLLELKRLAHKAKTGKRAGVLMLFYPSEERITRFVLILRKTYKGVHSAQVGFPGGRYEDGDLNFEHTALRETEEEVGVPSKDVTVIRRLTELYIPPSNFFVQPYMGITKRYPDFVPEASEVDAIIEVPLSEFMNEKVRITKTLSTSYAENLEVPAFELQDHVVWGATAMMLNEARQLLIQTL
ncbi:CoA pyrophosphatase [Aureitalea sp. L0-47]|uniref:NUDIX hydrolase n=1 Tax=Aureitalea sp. L0-47 TaxID=2816962 RepID=UPI002237BFE6|nr:CoA pyrophosphatase [Aureitalea sp. L0-47]MCW5519788.1 CoA pyrophosphatase [Aureitalea sp. L0-47]